MSSEQTAQPRPPAVDTVREGAPPEVVGPWLAQQLDDPRWATCDVTPIGDGRSNLTFGVHSPAGSVVLRRPPLGSVAATAHDMGRERTVLTALAGTAVPVPQVLAGQREADLLGAPFYVMELVEGTVPTGAEGDAWADRPGVRARAGAAMVNCLAELHSIDPSSVGLAEFGRPEGFMARQLRRWSAQWETWRDGLAAASGSDSPRPELTRLAERLSVAVPTSAGASIVHGDYRLENMIFAPEDPAQVRAVLDWEMSTLGDPLSDLGLMFIYWHQAEEQDVWRAAQVLPSVTRLPGFPTRIELLHHYAHRRDLDPQALEQDIQFYVAFGAFKLAVVLAGVAARANAGAADARTAAGILTALDPLVALGHHVLDHGVR
ncbi:phosphotransferase family protein [Rhodococcus sp. X156]|uniref:phosphotransferase family protein n=1 Tax=Rhodococcus sp. X156 TaxID=2499145 RepID=UPI000FD8A5E9|nr:phosphotransferase family protein [Rhodococcus sp. X156]